jgi:hypothetical protein
VLNVLPKSCQTLGQVSKNSEGFVCVAIDGRFMAMVKYSAKTRLPSHVELATKPTYWVFYTKNKYGIIREMTGWTLLKLQARGKVEFLVHPVNSNEVKVFLTLIKAFSKTSTSNFATRNLRS